MFFDELLSLDFQEPFTKLLIIVPLMRSDE